MVFVGQKADVLLTASTLKQPSASLLSRELFSVHLASHVIFAECV
jgi:hypothetical protein